MTRITWPLHPPGNISLVWKNTAPLFQRVDNIFYRGATLTPSFNNLVTWSRHTKARLFPPMSTSLLHGNQNMLFSTWWWIIELDAPFETRWQHFCCAANMTRGMWPNKKTSDILGGLIGVVTIRYIYVWDEILTHKKQETKIQLTMELAYVNLTSMGHLPCRGGRIVSANVRARPFSPFTTVQG